MKYDIAKPARQVAMVLDLNKCLGCHTCSVACKKMWNTDSGTDYSYWNNVETLPGKGFPKQWHEIGGRTDDGDVTALKIFYCLGVGHPHERRRVRVDHGDSAPSQ